MNKLKNKVFYMTIAIFTISVLSIIVIFNTQNYIEQKNSVENSLNVATNNGKERGDKPPEKPSGDNNDMGEPPAKPDGDDTDSNMEEPPARPNEDNNSSSNEKGQMPTGNPGEQMLEMKKTTISIIYYVIFGVESLVLTILVMYLIMSNFNKRTFRETFANKYRIIITILSVIVLTAGLTYLDVYLTN